MCIPQGMRGFGWEDTLGNYIIFQMFLKWIFRFFLRFFFKIHLFKTFLNIFINTRLLERFASIFYLNCEHVLFVYILKQKKTNFADF